MTLVTLPISLTPARLFIISLMRHFERRKWLAYAYPIAFAIQAYLASFNIDRIRYIGIFGSAIMAVFLLYILAFYWRFAYSPNNAAILRARSYEIDQNFISTQVEDGGISTYNWNRVKEVKSHSKYYLLYTSLTQFIYLTREAFRSEEELTAFEGILISKGLLKG